MVDFLLVVPPEYVEVSEIEQLIVDGAVPPEDIYSWIEQGAWADLENLFISAAVMPIGVTITGGRLIVTDAGYRFWVKFQAV